MRITLRFGFYNFRLLDRFVDFCKFFSVDLPVRVEIELVKVELVVGLGRLLLLGLLGLWSLWSDHGGCVNMRE